MKLPNKLTSLVVVYKEPGQSSGLSLLQSTFGQGDLAYTIFLYKKQESWGINLSSGELLDSIGHSKAVCEQSLISAQYLNVIQQRNPHILSLLSVFRFRH